MATDQIDGTRLRRFAQPMGVRPGAMVWYGTEKRHNNIELDPAISIDTGETRSSYQGIVEWLEEKARRAVKDEFGRTICKGMN